jgi:dihydroneopterin aldolase
VSFGQAHEDRIFLEGLRFRACHGVYPEERALGQDFEVDLELERSCVKAARTDALADTLDYAPLAALVLEQGQGPSCALIEHLAGRIAEAVLLRHPEVRVTVTVRKFSPALAGQPRVAGVRLVRGPSQA